MTSIDLVFEDELFDRHYSAITNDAPFAHLPWPMLDRMIDGLRAPSLTFVIAEPGAGKSTMVDQLSTELARQKIPVLSFLLDEPPWRSVRRGIVRLSNGRISLSAFEAAHEDEMKEAIETYLGEVAPNLAIIAEPVSTIEIGSLAGKCERERPGKLVIVVDYTQLVRLPDESSRTDERLAVRSIVAGLKRVAEQHNAAIVAISSINRTSYADKGITLASLSESNALEYGADLVISLQVKGKGDARSENIAKSMRPVTVSVLKNRFGALGQVSMLFDTEHAQFVEAKDA